MRCEHNNKLYKLKKISKENHFANVVEGTSEKISIWKTWHKRLGHLGIKHMKTVKAEDTDLASKKLIR